MSFAKRQKSHPYRQHTGQIRYSTQTNNPKQDDRTPGREGHHVNAKRYTQRTRRLSITQHKTQVGVFRSSFMISTTLTTEHAWQSCNLGNTASLSPYIFTVNINVAMLQSK